MTTLTRKEAQQVLEALNEYVGVVVSVNDPYNWDTKVADGGEPARKAIETLRARLSAPECVCNEPYTAGVHRQDGPCYQQTKREWQGLTDEAIWLEYQRLWLFHPAEEPTLAKDIARFARAIEQALREKNK